VKPAADREEPRTSGRCG